MKKLLSIILSALLLFGGCLAVGEENYAEEYVNSIRTAYQEIATKNDFLYHVENSINSEYHEKNVISADVIIDAYTSYSFDMWLEGASEFALRTYFSMNSASDDKSFIIYCANDEVSANIIKELIVATLYVVDDNMNEEKEETILKQLVNTYNGKNHSSIYVNDNYHLFVSYSVSYGGDVETTINVVDNRRLVLSDEEKSTYIKMTYDEICAPLNAGEAVCFEGVPIERLENQSSDWLDVGREYWNVQLADGIVHLQFNFDTYPFVIEQDVPYTFYGYIIRGEHTGTGTVRLDGFELIK